MKNSIMIFVLTAVSLLGTRAVNGEGASDNHLHNTPILNREMEQLFEEGRLGEVVEQPQRSSLDVLMDSLLLEKAVPSETTGAREVKPVGCHEHDVRATRGQQHAVHK